MQSSFSVIKQSRILSGDTKEISTHYDFKADKKSEKNSDSADLGVTYEEAQKYVESYEKMGHSIINDAKKKRDFYIQEATEKSIEIEKKAYDKGYEQGKNNGYEDGRNEAIESAKDDADKIIKDAEDYLKSAKDEYAEYVDSKKTDILNLVLDVSRKVLKRDISENIDISKMVEEALELSKDENNVIIKCNSKHVEALKKNIDIWKPSYGIKEAIYVLPMDEMEEGKAIIEKDSGIIEVGIDIGLERIKNALFSN